MARKLNPEAAEATWLLDKARLLAVRDEARRLKYSSPEIAKVEELMAKDEEAFLKLQAPRLNRTPTRALTLTSSSSCRSSSAA